MGDSDYDVIDLGDDPTAVEQVPDDEGTECNICGENLPTNRGMKIHKSRVHGVKTPKSAKAPSSNSNRVSPGSNKKKPQLLNTGTKFTRTSRDLTTDLAAAGVAYMAVRWIESQGIVIPKQDREQFLISDSDRGAMFKPILDGLEQVTPVVRIINTIAERFDYITCALMWKAYAQSIKEYADARKELGDNGPTRQSFAAINEPDDGTGDVPFVRTNGYSAADFS